VLAASGAAFTAVVSGQMANAFACRSASQTPGKLGWSSNRYLLLAVLCETGMLFGFLYVPALANLLGHTPPNAAGYLAAALAIPAVFLADMAQKHWRKKGLPRKRALPAPFA
jgi:F0F1-type ATP synthase membrane subunit c/vacuolar-type H+-ATPase subunit K